MAKLVLHIEPEVDFDLWALVTPLPDYRLSYFVNKATPLSFSRLNDLLILTKQKSEAAFSTFGFDDPLDHASYFLLGNKSETHQHMLVPELKQADFFLMVKNTPLDGTIDQIIAQINAISQVQTIFPVNAVALQSVNNLIFDNEDLYKNENTSYARPRI